MAHAIHNGTAIPSMMRAFLNQHAEEAVRDGVEVGMILGRYESKTEESQQMMQQITALLARVDEAHQEGRAIESRLEGPWDEDSEQLVDKLQRLAKEIDAIKAKVDFGRNQVDRLEVDINGIRAELDAIEKIPGVPESQPDGGGSKTM